MVSSEVPNPRKILKEETASACSGFGHCGPVGLDASGVHQISITKINHEHLPFLIHQLGISQFSTTSGKIEPALLILTFVLYVRVELAVSLFGSLQFWP